MRRTKIKPQSSLSPRSSGQKQVGRPRSDGRPQITRHDILQAASRLFADKGFSATSIKTIADVLRCHGTSIFNHFPTKEAILDELIEVTFGNEFGLFETMINIDAQPEVIVHRMVFEDALACMGDAVTIRSVFLLPELRTERFKKARLYWDKNTDIYAKLIERAKANGVFLEVSSKQAAEAIYTLCTTGLISLSQNKIGAKENFAEMLADMALRSLLCEPKNLSQIKPISRRLKIDWHPHTL